MSKYVEMTFCELPDTPAGFNRDKFLAGDPDQKILYKNSSFYPTIFLNV